jgi:hypothetical protein
MPDPRVPKVGDIWQDRDSRSQGRIVQVLKIDRGGLLGAKVLVKSSTSDLKTSIRVNVLRERFVFIEDRNGYSDLGATVRSTRLLHG